MCPWRYLPRGLLPPRSTVYNIFRQFQRESRWEAIWAELHMTRRERLGRDASPSAAVLDMFEQAIPGAQTRWTQFIAVLERARGNWTRVEFHEAELKLPSKLAALFQCG